LIQLKCQILKIIIFLVNKNLSIVFLTMKKTYQIY